MPFPSESASIKDILHELIPQALYGPLVAPRLHREHPCFRGARSLCIENNIPSSVLENFIELVCGSPRFPTILLLDSRLDMDNPSFNEMVDTSATLLWIEDALERAGLCLADVSILDMSAFSRATRPVSPVKVQPVLESVLQALRPATLVALRSATTTRIPSVCSNSALHNALFPSLFIREAGSVRVATMREHKVHIVEAVHPLSLNEIGNEFQISSSLLRQMYKPCADWKYPVEALMSMDQEFYEEFPSPPIGIGIAKFGAVGLLLDDITVRALPVSFQ